jgi:hypothetical protein
MKNLKSLLLAGLVSVAAVSSATGGIVKVDIYREFDLNNPPTAQPFSDYVGTYYVPSSEFYSYDFGTPFGLSAFAAVLQFTMYFSAEGYYKGGAASFTNPFYWNGGYPNPWYDNGWAMGSNYAEVPFEEGYSSFEIFVIGTSKIPIGGGDFTGPPYTLGISFPVPWGGDPRLENAYSFVVPDEINTLPCILALLGCASLFRARKLSRR